MVVISCYLSMQWIFSLFQIFVAIFPIVENGIQIWNAININDTKFSIETVIPSKPQPPELHSK